MQIPRHEYSEEFEYQDPAYERRSIGELFSNLTANLSTLLRDEVELARNEIKGKASLLGKDAVMVVLGAAILYGGFLSLLAGCIIWLSYAVQPWLAVLLVTMLVLTIGGIMVGLGIKRMKHKDIKPSKAMDSLKENVKWIRQNIK
jgi:uncharacterized membrane protein YqjE